jgi:L-ribulose-5-phosphate 3-epimerase UlaE
MPGALLILVLAADLASVRAEPDFFKRSQKAVEHAQQSLTKAREAWNKGDLKAYEAQLEEAAAAAELCLTALESDGRHPSKLGNQYKKAEQKTRDLLRRAENFARDVGIDDRPLAEKLVERIQKVHDQLLAGVMSKKP